MLNAYSGNGKYIFVSYSHRDSDEVMPILQQMADNGYQIWYDEGIEPGSEWFENIGSHIAGCRCAVVFISENMINSKYCRRELNHIIDRDKDFVAVYLHPTTLSEGMAMQLSVIQALYKEKYTENVFIDKLCSVPFVTECKSDIVSVTEYSFGASTPSAPPPAPGRSSYNATTTTYTPNGPVVTRPVIDGVEQAVPPVIPTPAGTPAAPPAFDAPVTLHLPRGLTLDTGIAMNDSTLRQAYECLEQEKWVRAFSHLTYLLRQGVKHAAVYIGLIMSCCHASTFDKLTDAKSPLSKSEYFADAVRLASPEIAQMLNQFNTSIICRTEGSKIFGTVAAAPAPAAPVTTPLSPIARAYRTGKVAAGARHSVFVTPSGTVVACGDNSFGQCNVESLGDVVSVCAGRFHTAALKKDGTCVAVGSNRYKQCNVTEWTNVVAICAGDLFTAGLKSDGTVVFTDSMMPKWKEVCKLFCGGERVAMVANDGSFNATVRKETRDLTASWGNVTSVAFDLSGVIGLSGNGTLMFAGVDEKLQKLLETQKDIADIKGNSEIIALLHYDGSAFACDREGNPIPLDGWNGIIYISVGYKHLIGLKADGTVVCAGEKADNRCDISGRKASIPTD